MRSRRRRRDAPFLAASVDCILAPEVYEHLYHPDRFLEEAYRVLRPGCSLVLTTPNTESLALMVLRRLPRRWAQRILTREGAAKANLHGEFFGDLEKGSPHGHCVEGASLAEMERMAARFGFRQVRETTWGLPFCAGFPCENRPEDLEHGREREESPGQSPPRTKGLAHHAQRG